MEKLDKNYLYKSNKELLEINKKRNLFKNKIEEYNFNVIIKECMYNYFLNHDLRSHFFNSKIKKYVDNPFKKICNMFSIHELFRIILIEWLFNLEKIFKHNLIKTIKTKTKNIFVEKKILLKFVNKKERENINNTNIRFLLLTKIKKNRKEKNISFGFLNRLIYCLNDKLLVSFFKKLNLDFLLFREGKKDISIKSVDSILRFLNDCRNNLAHGDHLFKYGINNNPFPVNLFKTLKFKLNDKIVYCKPFMHDHVTLLIYLMGSFYKRNDKLFKIPLSNRKKLSDLYKNFNKSIVIEKINMNILFLYLDFYVKQTNKTIFIKGI